MKNLLHPDLFTKEKYFAIERATHTKKINNSLPQSVPHYHSHYEILYIQRGTKTLNINNFQSFTLDCDHIALIKPNIVHNTSSQHDTEQTRVLLNLSQNLVDDILSFTSKQFISLFNEPVITLPSFNKKMISYNFEELLSLNEDDPLINQKTRILVSNLIYTLNDALSKSSSKNISDYTYSQSMFDNITYISQYIQSNYSEPLTISQLANKIFISETLFFQLFKKIIGVSPYQYITNIRIANATILLKNKQYSISKIAEICGFNTIVNFSRAFKKFYKLSPSEYRKLL